MDQMRQQSINCGAQVETLTVDKVDLSAKPFKVHVGGQVHLAESLILATGANRQTFTYSW